MAVVSNMRFSNNPRESVQVVVEFLGDGAISAVLPYVFL